MSRTEAEPRGGVAGLDRTGWREIWFKEDWWAIWLGLGIVVIGTIGQWDQAATYNLEPPLVALAAGLLISNLVGLPAWLDAGFRVEFYIKLGIVLLGATLPFTLIVWAGPIAILQASIVSITT